MSDVFFYNGTTGYAIWTGGLWRVLVVSGECWLTRTNHNSQEPTRTHKNPHRFHQNPSELAETPQNSQNLLILVGSGGLW